MKTKKAKVIIAMSGGVDSSVAAALLKKVGFEAVGVFLKLNKFSLEAEKRARRVAKILKIPFFVLNLEKEFKKRVIDYFLREYKRGRTPNPCVVCNKEIKFGLLLEKGLMMGADYIATGHYAQFRKGRLFRAKDKEKDQSYFLWQLSQEQLEHVLFPVGDYTKKEVRNLAKKFGLPSYRTPESMEICFIRTTTEDFFKKHIKEKAGEIMDNKNRILGQHQGLWFYTIGQRKGIKLAGGLALVKATAGKPYFVLEKDSKRNILIVTQNEKDLYKKEIKVGNIGWISGKKPEFPLKIFAKIRYRHNPATAILSEMKDKKYKIVFNNPQRAVTPGQSAVFYKGNEVLGGGIIEK